MGVGILSTSEVGCIGEVNVLKPGVLFETEYLFSFKFNYVKS